MAMSGETKGDERSVQAAVNEVINRLLDFDEETRRRILRTVQTFLSMPSVRKTSFSESAELSPKDFLLRKKPQTDVERVACLAYYLAHYRDTPYFKTIDISLLNTEAAQVKFSNAAYAVVNATNAGLLVPAGKGSKQLSAQGERYVEALPDRAAAKEILANLRTRRGRRPSKNNKDSEE
jgi:hypothetical protein